MLFRQEEIRKHLNKKQRKKNKHKNNDDLKETQELNDFIKQFPDFFDEYYIRSAEDKRITFDDLYLAIKGEKVPEILDYKITNETQSKDIKYLKMLQACAVCEVLDKGYGLCNLCISDCVGNDNNILVQKVGEIILDSKKAFTGHWFPSQKLRYDLVNNVNDNKYFFVQFNSNKKSLVKEKKGSRTYTIPLSMYLAMRFIAQWYDTCNNDKHEDKILQGRFGAIMQYLDYSLRSYSLYNKDNNKTKFNDAAEFVLEYIVKPYHDLLRKEIVEDNGYTINDVSYRYSILNLVRMYEKMDELNLLSSQTAVMKYVYYDDYYLGNESVTEEDMRDVLNKYKENFVNKPKKSQNSSLHESENDSNYNNDNENDEKENNNETKKFLRFKSRRHERKKNAMKSVYKKKYHQKKNFQRYLDIPDGIPEITFKNREMFKNQESSDNSVSQGMKDGVKKQSKNGTTKPDVRNANLSPPYSVKKQSVKTTHSPITNNPLPQPQPVNNKPAETNKSGKSNKVKDDSTQKPKEKSQDKKNIKNKTSNVEKNKHKTKKIINTKSELNNEDQKDQTSNAYIYSFIALCVIVVVSVIAFFIYRNFVSNVASSESLQNYATNLLSV